MTLVLKEGNHYEVNGRFPGTIELAGDCYQLHYRDKTFDITEVNEMIDGEKAVLTLGRRIKVVVAPSPILKAVSA
jgi:hypothetical protein